MGLVYKSPVEGSQVALEVASKLRGGFEKSRKAILNNHSSKK